MTFVVDWTLKDNDLSAVTWCVCVVWSGGVHECPAGGRQPDAGDDGGASAAGVPRSGAVRPLHAAHLRSVTMYMKYMKYI